MPTLWQYTSAACFPLLDSSMAFKRRPPFCCHCKTARVASDWNWVGRGDERWNHWLPRCSRRHDLSCCFFTDLSDAGFFIKQSPFVALAASSSFYSRAGRYLCFMGSPEKFPQASSFLKDASLSH